MYISERIPHVRRVVKKETFELLLKMQTERALGDRVIWPQVTIDNTIVAIFFVYLCLQCDTSVV